jgi:hypothetical protein
MGGPVNVGNCLDPCQLVLLSLLDHSRVVHDDLELAQPRRNLCNQPCYCRAVRQVGGKGSMTRTKFIKPLENARCSCRNCDPCARCRQGLCNRKSDTLCGSGPGHQCHPPTHSSHA